MTQSEHALTVADPSWRARTIETLASISEAVCFLDGDDRLTWANAAAERLLQRPAEGLIGRELWAEFPQLLDSPLPEAFGTARTTRLAQHVEFFHPAVDRWCEVRAYPNGESVGVFFHDVHERRLLDEQRAAESTLIRAVLNALPSRTAILDGDGTILTTNAAWARATAAEGRPFASRVGVNYLGAVRAAGAGGTQGAGATVEGMEAVFAGSVTSFSLDYAIRPGGDRT